MSCAHVVYYMSSVWRVLRVYLVSAMMFVSVLRLIRCTVHLPSPSSCTIFSQCGTPRTYKAIWRVLRLRV